jgi:hypothetical protein
MNSVWREGIFMKMAYVLWWQILLFVGLCLSPSLFAMQGSDDSYVAMQENDAGSNGLTCSICLCVDKNKQLIVTD